MQPGIDLSWIDSTLLRENYLALLGFPVGGGSRGYIPLRVTAREQFYFMYDPLQEAQITAKVPAGTGANGISDLGFVKPALPGSQYLTGKPFNVFEVSQNNHLYQLFMGIAPEPTRIFFELPATVGQRNLDIDTWASAKLQFGYIDGYDSPLLAPTPRGEIIIPPTMDIAWGYGNPIEQVIDPLLLFVVNRLQVDLVTDADLVERMLNGKVTAAIKTVGGLTSYTYSTSQVYGIEPLPLGATRDEVEAVLGPSPAGSQAPPSTPSKSVGPQSQPLVQQAQRRFLR